MEGILWGMHRVSSKRQQQKIEWFCGSLKRVYTSRGDVRGRRREKEKDIMVSAFGENVVWIRMKQMVGMMMAACVVNHST